MDTTWCRSCLRCGGSAMDVAGDGAGPPFTWRVPDSIGTQSPNGKAAFFSYSRFTPGIDV